MKRFFCLLLAIVILCAGCSSTVPSSESTSSQKSESLSESSPAISAEDSNKTLAISGNSETNTVESIPTDKSIQESSPSLISKEDVEQLFNAVYKSNLTVLPNPLREGEKLTPQQAYYFFQFYEISHHVTYAKRAEIQTKIDGVAYYPQDMVEAFVGDHFDLSVEEMRTDESYVSNAAGYVERINGGKDKNEVTLLESKETKEGWTVSFAYTDNVVKTTTLGDISFREKDSHLVLSSFQMKKADK